MKLMAPLYMLRHGETAWNTERRMQGTKNSALTERGRAQAIAMGRTLKVELALEPGPTVFLRSPLGRTCETALLIGRELGLAAGEWRDDPRLAELSYGEWVRRRTHAALSDIIAGNIRTVVVSHGVSGAVLRGLNLGLDARAMFVLEKPQDAFFRLTHGAEERILAQGLIDALPAAG